MCLLRSILFAHLIFFTLPLAAEERRKLFKQGNHYLVVEAMDDDTLHLAWSSKPLDEAASLAKSPLMEYAQFADLKNFKSDQQSVRTSRVQAVVDSRLCVRLSAVDNSSTNSFFCPKTMDNDWKVLGLQIPAAKQIYGFGQIFPKVDSDDTDWIGQKVTTSGDYGNSLRTYAGGAVGDTLFPAFYGLADDGSAVLTILDNHYKQDWDLTDRKTWTVGMFGDDVRLFWTAAKHPRLLRRRLMNMLGHAPVPPRKMFGLWLSEYGYDNWREIGDLLNGMRRDKMPMDGFFLDLQWFGGVRARSDYTRMGTLTFDLENFPSPEDIVKRLRRDEDIGLIPIEEPYVGKGLEEYRDLEQRQYMAFNCGNSKEASYLTAQVHGNDSEWWGRGGILDYSNPKAGDFWHDLKRAPLIKLGIMGHWMDLGEPEMFDRHACYNGLPNGKNRHADIHNIFSLKWAESVARGYDRDDLKQRSFMMLRSGNLGLQRYGAGMWSGDISGNLPSLVGHVQTSNNLAWVGIDYYSSDIGGFHRNSVNNQPLIGQEVQENFTQWFAMSTWFDIPVRPHTINLDHNRQTAPNLIGHVESNRSNLLLRYALTPFYYSLAHAAWRTGDPIFMPMAMVFPRDDVARKILKQRMLGDKVLVAFDARNGAYATDVYLPEGLWFDGRSWEWRHSRGEWLRGVPLWRDGLFKLPWYASAGAIIPMSNEGQQKMQSPRDTRIAPMDHLIVFGGADSTEFTLYEDDGVSTAYQRGDLRATRIRQRTSAKSMEIQIDAAHGDFANSSPERTWTVRAVLPGQEFKFVEVNGVAYEQCQSDTERRCWDTFDTMPHVVDVRLPLARVTKSINILVGMDDLLPMRTSVHVVCESSTRGAEHASIYVAGNTPELGNWDPWHAVPLMTHAFMHGIWSAYITDLPPGKTIEWKCLRRPPAGNGHDVEWEPGANRVLQTPDSGGFFGVARGGWHHIFGSRANNS